MELARLFIYLFYFWTVNDLNVIPVKPDYPPNALRRLSALGQSNAEH
jgi:hypothetical protein